MDKQFQHIIKQGENERVEFKSSFNDEIIISLVAFANTKGGVVYVGIDDNGTISGVHIGKETIAQWVNEVKNKTAPSVIPDAELIEAVEGKLVALSIQEYPVKPVSFRGKYYKRIKNANHQLQVSEVVNMHLQSLNTSWDAYPDPMHTLADISIEKITLSMERLRNRGLTITETSLDFLVKNDLVREDKPTHAAYLLFKKKHSISTTIELGRFQDAITIKDTSRSQADLIAQVDDVMSFVKKHMTVALIITGEVENKQQWQYPLEAIREIVLNMIIHRDYRANADSVVKIFDDKIEFYNPGKLPDEISVEDLFKNNYKSSPRNKSIAEFFKNIGLIEKYGSGIGRIINYFKESNLPLPKFENHSGGFLVTVYAPDKDQSKENVTENVTQNVTENVTENRTTYILEAIRNNPKITTKILSQQLNIARMTLHRDLEKLKNEGIIKRIGSDKGGYWQVLKPD
jgi:ATP-dependent DNA helicase RecG